MSSTDDLSRVQRDAYEWLNDASKTWSLKPLAKYHLDVILNLMDERLKPESGKVQDLKRTLKTLRTAYAQLARENDETEQELDSIKEALGID